MFDIHNQPITMTSADLTVVLPNYNHARFLPRALDAILAQSVQPREILALDDASTDDSLSVLEQYARRHPSIRVIRNERNLGVVAILNHGTELATSRYIHYAAADDYILPGFYEKTCTQLERHPHAGLCSTYDSCQYGENGPLEPNPSGWNQAGYFAPDEVCRGLRHTIPGHATICRRDRLIEAGGFLPELKWYCDWFALVTVAFRHGACHVPEMLSIRLLMPRNYSSEAQQRDANIPVLTAFFDTITSSHYGDVAPYFRRNGGATYFGTDLIRAAAHRPDLWEPRILGFLNGFRPEEYAELLTDEDPIVREVAAFFLGPFWKQHAEQQAQQKHEILRLQNELEHTCRQVPPPGAAGKFRWLAGKVKARLLRAG